MGPQRLSSSTSLALTSFLSNSRWADGMWMTLGYIIPKPMASFTNKSKIDRVSKRQNLCIINSHVKMPLDPTHMLPSTLTPHSAFDWSSVRIRKVKGPNTQKLLMRPTHTGTSRSAQNWRTSGFAYFVCVLGGKVAKAEIARAKGRHEGTGRYEWGWGVWLKLTKNQ